MTVTMLDADEDGLLHVYSAGRRLGTIRFDEDALTWHATCTCGTRAAEDPKRYRAAGNLHDHWLGRHGLPRDAAA